MLLISSDLHNDLLQMSNPQLFQYGAWLYLILNIIVAVLVQSPKRDLPVLSGADGRDPAVGIVLFWRRNAERHRQPADRRRRHRQYSPAGRVGFFIAAVAATGLIYLTFYLSISRSEASSQYVRAGALGTLCFAAAFLVQD